LNRKAALTRRQRHVYLDIIRHVHKKPTYTCNHDIWVQHKWQCNESWARAAYGFAKQWGGRKGVDLKKLQHIVLKYGGAPVLYRYARDVPSANIKRFQKAIIETEDFKYVQLFADNIPKADQKILGNVLIILEIFDI
jgi:hypothetical protein